MYNTPSTALSQPPNPPQLLVMLRHGAFCDEHGRYACALARQNAAAFEEALAYEMQAAAQSSAYGECGMCKVGGGLVAGLVHGGHRVLCSASCVVVGTNLLPCARCLKPTPLPRTGYRAVDVGQGRLGPAISLGPAGAGFPTLDDASLRRSIPEAAVLDAAADAAAARVADGGGAAYLNLQPFMNLAVTTGKGAGCWPGWQVCGAQKWWQGLDSVADGLAASYTAAVRRQLKKPRITSDSRPTAPVSNPAQCAPRPPPTACTTCSCPCPCATCVWWTGSRAAAASSREKTWTTLRAWGPGGAPWSGAV